ncbi:Zinc finger, RING-type [Gossypium australe]|uniref:Zinc finger, RING-type n=1 Tax=Gossypium australe TaxID=47621 RepID=A0A5B6W2I4_9ROSI|nr:Zinc finger, RING-type [Gossypium australe]
MKTIRISQDDVTKENSRYVFHSSMTITTNSKILKNSDRSPRWQAQKSECHGQFFTVIGQTKLLPFFIHVMECKTDVGFVTSFLYQNHDLINLGIDLSSSRMPSVFRHKGVHPAVYLDPTTPRLLTDPLPFHCSSNPCGVFPFSGSRIHHFWTLIQRGSLLLFPPIPGCPALYMQQEGPSTQLHPVPHPFHSTTFLLQRVFQSDPRGQSYKHSVQDLV